MSSAIAEIVENIIRAIAEQRNLKLPPLTGSAEIVDDLGFTSLTVAALIANLEEVLGVDPFQDENVTITDVRTVGDLCAVYERCFASAMSANLPSSLEAQEA